MMTTAASPLARTTSPMEGRSTALEGAIVASVSSLPGVEWGGRAVGGRAWRVFVPELAPFAR